MLARETATRPREQVHLDVSCASSFFTSVTNCVDMPEHMKAISHAGVLRSAGELHETFFPNLFSYGAASICCMVLEAYHIRLRTPKAGASLNIEAL